MSKLRGMAFFVISLDKDIRITHSSPTLCNVCDISLLCLGHLCGGIMCLGGSHVPWG